MIIITLTMIFYRFYFELKEQYRLLKKLTQIENDMSSKENKTKN